MTSLRTGCNMSRYNKTSVEPRFVCENVLEVKDIQLSTRGSDGGQETFTAGRSDHLADRTISVDGILNGRLDACQIRSAETVLFVAAGELNVDHVVISEVDGSDGGRTGDLHYQKNEGCQLSVFCAAHLIPLVVCIVAGRPSGVNLLILV